jgi:sugar lactone lactonase YvrE
MVRIARALGAVLVVALLTAASSVDPRSIPLPVDFAPEGVAVGYGHHFYAGSLTRGDVYRGDLRTGEGSVLVDAPPGRSAAGLKVDESHGWLVVAGGPTGHGYVYDARDGSQVADLTFTTAPNLINDVVVTRRALWFTDSFSPVLYKVPIRPRGELGTPQTIRLSGPAAALPVAFPNLNGIEATPDGSVLIVSHTALGALFTIDPASGQSAPITVPGGANTPGSSDGILLEGKSLWVVENSANQVVEIELSPDLSSGVHGSVITDTEVDGLFRVPTTVASFGSRLVVVNARFDLGFPPPFCPVITPCPPANTDFDVVVFDKQ